jgi:hypothetical protein
MQDGLECIAHGREPQSGFQLALDVIHVVYGAYLSAERMGQEVVLERI